MKCKRKLKSYAWLLLSFFVLVLAITPFIAKADQGVNLTSQQYQSLISNLKQAKTDLLKQKQTIQSLSDKLSKANSLTVQLSVQQQKQQDLYNKALEKINLQLKQLTDCQNLLEQVDQTVADQMVSIAKSQEALTDALLYSKQLEKEIRWLKIKAWLYLVAGFLIGHYI